MDSLLSTTHVVNGKYIYTNICEAWLFVQFVDKSEQNYKFTI